MPSSGQTFNFTCMYELVEFHVRFGWCDAEGVIIPLKATRSEAVCILCMCVCPHRFHAYDGLLNLGDIGDVVFI